MKHILNARVTYRSIPIHMLERFTFKDTATVYKMKDKYKLDELLIVQTCNRVELYAASSDVDDPSSLLDIWVEHLNLDRTMLEKSVELSKEKDVIHHLFRLASGLDSLVVGEDQILGQVKRALDNARKSNAVGMYLSMLFEKAVRVGSKVRTNTNISKGSISYGSIAIRLAEEYLHGLDRSKRVMLIGSGEAAAMVAKPLLNKGIEFLVTSRTMERARAFSESIGGRPIEFEYAMQEELSDMDVLFIATTAPYWLITYEKMVEVMEKRRSSKEGSSVDNIDGREDEKRRTLLIVDLSNPSTVEPRVDGIDGVKVIRFDEISSMAERNIATRMQEVSEAERIVREEVEAMESRLRRFEVEPIIDSLFRSVDRVRKRELDKALSMLRIDESSRQVVEQMSYAIVESILSIPMDELRKASERGDAELIKVASRLFKYEELEEHEGIQMNKL
ncbi:MAG: glutamyl-tRNA reductase [Candidatus Nitrosocaldus sp.]